MKYIVNMPFSQGVDANVNRFVNVRFLYADVLKALIITLRLLAS